MNLKADSEYLMPYMEVDKLYYEYIINYVSLYDMCCTDMNIYLLVTFDRSIRVYRAC